MQQQSLHRGWNISKWHASNRKVFKVGTHRGTLNYDGSDIRSQAFIELFSRKWTLKSLTIGPQRHRDTKFWVEAFKDLPPLPCVDSVTIIYHIPRPGTYNVDCWGYFDRTLARRDIFPALKSVYVRVTYGSYQLDCYRWRNILYSFQLIRAMRIGPCKPPVFEADQGTDPPYERSLVLNRRPRY